MSLAKGFAQQPPIWILTEMLVCLLGIGFLDYIAGYQIRLLPFYCGPIFVVAWFCDKRLGVLIGLAAGVVSLFADWFDGDPDLAGWSETWEIARHLGSCLTVALVGSALRAKSDIAAARIELLEHSQRLEREIVHISETEQRRIGQDLHDGLCQSLAALSCSAASLRDDLHEQMLPAEAKAAGELASRLREAIVQTRDLAHGLALAHVSQLGLAMSLESLAQSVARLQGVSCTFRSQFEEADCDERTAIHLYRIAQEAINNATRHGGARNIAISLDRSGELMRLQILDDGVGISESSPNGTGLTIMHYRARQSGGTLTIKQSREGGTLISCSARATRPQDEVTAA